MLECIAVVLCIVVEVVGVGKEIIACTEYIAAADIRTWQSHLFWTRNLEAVFRLAVECFAHFIAQIGVGILVANNLYSIRDTRSAMVGG